MEIIRLGLGLGLRRVMIIALIAGVGCFIYTSIDMLLQVAKHPMKPHYDLNNRTLDNTQYPLRIIEGTNAFYKIQKFYPTFILSLILIPLSVGYFLVLPLVFNKK